jgi:hypothetical protein
MADHSEPEQETRPVGPGETMGAFIDSFGKMDIYAQIVIEEFMEALLDKNQ